MTIYDYSLLQKDGSELSLNKFKNQVLLIVNTASKCGFTPQYDGLEALYQKYHNQGLVIIAVPSNEFGEEEPGTNDDIQTFCKVNFGVTFPVMAKASVRDEQAIPLFKYLTEQKGFDGFPESNKTEMLSNYLQTNHPEYLNGDSIKWNFTKFLINKKGQVVERFEPMVEPANIASSIEKLLAE